MEYKKFRNLRGVVEDIVGRKTKKGFLPLPYIIASAIISMVIVSMVIVSRDIVSNVMILVFIVTDAMM